MSPLVRALAILLLTLPQTAPKPNTRSIVPGVRMGPLTRTTRHSELAKLFPKAKIEEGGCEPEDAEAGLCGATLVTLGPGDALTILWKDEQKTRPSQVSVTGRGWGWKTSEGITPGMPVEELIKLVGTIRYHPWHQTTDPENGKLYDWAGSTLPKLEGKLNVWIGPADGSCEQDDSMLTGQLPADSDALEPCDPIVSRLGIDFVTSPR